MDSSSEISDEEFQQYDDIEAPDPNEEAWCATNEFSAVSLFDDFQSSDAGKVWNHMREKYGFDLNILREQISDFCDWKRIALINYLRRCQLSFSASAMASLVPLIPQMEPEWNTEQNLMPVRENDRLLWELPADFQICEDELPEKDTLMEKSDRTMADVCARNKDTDSIPDTFMSRIMKGKSTSASGDSVETQAPSALSETETDDRSKVTEDQGYFDSYSSLDIHREMILDSTRTRAYRDFILRNKALFKDKVVLDVGCGSGVLSMFCAQAGARLVVGVDAAAPTVNVARDIINDNGFSCIQLIIGKLENMDLWIVNDSQGSPTVVSCVRGAEPPQGAVPFSCDIIVSEWMGYCLLYEWMLFTVLDARDRYLTQSGLIVPNKASLQVWAADFSETIQQTLETWDDSTVYGLSLKRLKPNTDVFFSKPEVIVVPSHSVVSSPCTFLDIDLHTVTAAALQEMRCPFQFSGNARMTSLVFSFFCVFEDRNAMINGSCTESPVVLDTSPLGVPTHWRQTVCHLQAFNEPKRLQLVPKESTEDHTASVSGTISLGPEAGKNSRHLQLVVQLDPIKIDNGTQVVPGSVNRFLLK